MTRGLTDRQQAIFDFIVHSVVELSRPPSLRDICRHFDMASTRAASDHVNALVKKGYLVKEADVARGLRPVRSLMSESPAFRSQFEGTASRGHSLPLLGRVAAGAPMLAEDNVLDKILVDESICKDSGSFLLEVQGDSMIDAGIQPGDLIIVKPQETAEDGDIVVALFEEDGEATVKRLERRKGRVRLIPENSRLEPIPVPDPDALRIRGVVTGLIRKFR